MLSHSKENGHDIVGHIPPRKKVFVVHPLKEFEVIVFEMCVSLCKRMMDKRRRFYAVMLYEKFLVSTLSRVKTIILLRLVP